MATSFDEDPIMALKEATDMLAAELRATQAHTVASATNAAERAAIEQDPHYLDQVRFLKDSYRAGLIASGQSPETAEQMVTQASWKWAAEAQRAGRDLVEDVREAAARAGWQPPRDDSQIFGDALRALQREQRAASAPTQADEAFRKIFGGG